MNFLILGGMGYLGSHIVKRLDTESNSIFLLIRNDEQAMILPLDRQYVKVVNRRDIVENTFKNHTIDWIINCMGKYKDVDPYDIIDGNLMTPVYVMESAVRHGVKNIININTSLPPELNLYSYTKRSLGDFGHFLSVNHNINFYNILLELFFGPDEPDNRLITSLIHKMKNNEDIYLSEGTQYRDIIHIEDVCRAVLKLVDLEKEGYYDVPLGTGEKHTIKEMVYFLYKEIRSESKLLWGGIPLRRGEPDCIADMSFLNSIGYQNKYTWETGLRSMVLGR